MDTSDKCAIEDIVMSLAKYIRDSTVAGSERPRRDIDPVWEQAKRDLGGIFTRWHEPQQHSEDRG